MLDELPKSVHDLGHNVFYSKVVNSAEEWVGIHVWHRCKDRDGVERWDAGYVPFVGSRAWTVNSFDPLDISPSVLQPACGFHGFIRQGHWEPC